MSTTAAATPTAWRNTGEDVWVGPTTTIANGSAQISLTPTYIVGEGTSVSLDAGDDLIPPSLISTVGVALVSLATAHPPHLDVV